MHLCFFFLLTRTDYTDKGMTAHHLQICNRMSDLAMLGVPDLQPSPG